MDLINLTLAQLQEGFRAGKFTPVDAIKAFEAKHRASQPWLFRDA